MTLLSRTGYAPERKIQYPVPRHINYDQISIVVPVKNNQSGINRLLSSLENIYQSGQRFLEVIVVDNLSASPIVLEEQYSFRLTLCVCSVPGPAGARNFGSSHADGEWLLFIDSDCTPTDSAISGYCKSDNKHLAYAGNVVVENIDILSKYYSDQEILIPPKTLDRGGERPDYLITANCLVLKSAFQNVGGFDESFFLAGGEDIDLGFKLLCHGSIDYQWNSVVKHSFSDGLEGFLNRFRRYGIGNQILSRKYNLNLTPRPFIPCKFSLPNLLFSVLQYLSMKRGYSELLELQLVDAEKA